MKKSKLIAAVVAILALTFILSACNTEPPVINNYYFTYSEADDYLIGIAAHAMKSTVRIETPSGGKTKVGTGVIIATDETNNRTYIVTNNHVVRKESKPNVFDLEVNPIKVFFPDNSAQGVYIEATATYIISTNADPTSDLALISIPYSSKHFAAVYSVEGLQYGQRVLAAGSGLAYDLSVCDGLVSNPSLELKTDHFKATVIQTSAPINSGNSGGGLFDMRGNLVGINTMKAVVSDKDDVTVFADNISFAIKMSQVKAYVNEYNLTQISKKIIMTAYVAPTE